MITKNYELFLIQIGSTWTLDTLFLILIPISIVGFVLNSISLFVLFKINIKDTRLYLFLRVYTFNSVLICLLSSTSFIPFVPRYVNISNSYVSRFYRCVLMSFGGSTLFLYSNLIEILINLERLSIFKTYYKNFTNKFSPIVLLIIFISSNLINTPFLFWYYAKSDQEFLNGKILDFINSSNISSFTYCGRTNFLKTNYGLILSILNISIRDLFTLISEIFTGILIIIYFNKYIKGRILKLKPNERTSLNMTVEDLQISKTINENDIHRISFRKSFNMVVSITFLSVIVHIISLLSYCLYLISAKYDIFNLWSNFFTFFIIFFLLIKNLSNFFIFYEFNSNFKNLLRLKN